MSAPTMEQARALLARADGLSREDLQKELDALPAEARAAYYNLRKDSFFVPENAGAPKEYLSPSGRYRLVVIPYSTSPGAWGYTQGLVYDVGSDTPIAEIRRNYSSFPHLFTEDHPNGHPYLIGGENYQGQTVVELDTGRRRDFLPEAADKGFGFCWAQMRFDAPSRVLTVDGCIWACPYEYRFYDFADPMSGWPELKIGYVGYTRRAEAKLRETEKILQLAMSEGLRAVEAARAGRPYPEGTLGERLWGWITGSKV